MDSFALVAAGDLLGGLYSLAMLLLKDTLENVGFSNKSFDFGPLLENDLVEGHCYFLSCPRKEN